MAAIRSCSKQIVQLTRQPIASLARSCLSLSSSHSNSTSRSHSHAQLTPSQLNNPSWRQSLSGEASGGPSAKAKANGRRLQVITGSLTAFFGASYILYLQLKAKEEEEEEKEGGEVKDDKEVHTYVCETEMFSYTMPVERGGAWLCFKIPVIRVPSEWCSNPTRKISAFLVALF